MNDLPAMLGTYGWKLGPDGEFVRTQKPGFVKKYLRINKRLEKTHRRRRLRREGYQALLEAIRDGEEV